MMTSLGWHAQKLPASLAVLALAAMYVIEVLAPFLLFCVGWPRAVAAGLVLLLQVGIQLGGNFGHFNVLTIVLCVPLLACGGDGSAVGESVAKAMATPTL